MEPCATVFNQNQKTSYALEICVDRLYYETTTFSVSIDYYTLDYTTFIQN